MPWHKILADLIVIFHASFFCFVVLGLVAILLGIAFRWGWVRNFWFRTAHLTAITIVAIEAILGIPCPLTDWENQLRVAAGQVAYPGEFLGYWAHQFIFYQADPWVFTALHVGFGLAVVLAFVLAPPKWPRWQS
jgi:hypothetical protein